MRAAFMGHDLSACLAPIYASPRAATHSRSIGHQHDLFSGLFLLAEKVRSGTYQSGRRPLHHRLRPRLFYCICTRLFLFFWLFAVLVTTLLDRLAGLFIRLGFMPASTAPRA